jgi:uncharacterized protein (TIGR00251 family)
MSAKPSIEPSDGGVLLRVRVQPRASRSRVTTDSEGAIRVAVTAPPADGEANRAVVEAVARALGLAKSRVRIHSGERSRNKTLRIDDIDLESVRKPLEAVRKD